MSLGDKMIGVAVGVLITLAIAAEVQTQIATYTGVGGIFENTAAGSLIVLIPLVMVAGLLGFAWVRRNS